MATKDFMRNLKKDTRSMTPSPEIVLPAPVPEEELPAPKKKRGRPKVKTEPERTINISVPVEILEKMDIAKVCYGNNLTAYVNAVIKADLQANYEKYSSIKSMMDAYK